MPPRANNCSILSKYSADEISARERALEETIVTLHAPLHANCYLSPSQFAEKFEPKLDEEDNYDDENAATGN